MTHLFEIRPFARGRDAAVRRRASGMGPMALGLLCASVGCASRPRVPSPIAQTASLGVVRYEGLVSDPVEYRLDRASASAGEHIFVRSGVGDPYRTGVALPVFLALIEGFPSLFGGDMRGFRSAFGMLESAVGDRDARAGLPVGLHLTDDPNTGVPFVVSSCALCHAERVRWPGGSALIMGLGNRTLQIHRYDAAFDLVATNERFTVETVRALADAAAARERIPWPIEVRGPIVEATVRALRERAPLRSDLQRRTRDALPGRVAVIESFAEAMTSLLRRPIETSETVGWTRIPDVIGFAQRRTLSWDGSGEGPIDALVVEAGFAFNARPEWFYAHPHQGRSLSEYLRGLQRDLRFPRPIDRTLADRGRAHFNERCAGCHGEYRADGSIVYREQVRPLEELGVDPARALAVTPSFVRASNHWRLAVPDSRVRNTGGYVPPVLRSLWMRAPFGHNGQWPSLAVIATAPEARPQRFVVDPDAPMDLDAVGVRTLPADSARSGNQYDFDGARPGFSTSGHPFLSDLGPAAARAVIEYLVTL